MPFVNIKIAGAALAPEQVRKLQQGATDLMASIMRKNADLTAVLVEQQVLGSWTVGRKPAATAAHLTVIVTAGTNTADEKANFVREAMSLLRSVLGADLNPVTYVVIDEVAAGAWGWDGQTQEQRAALAKAANP